MPYANVEDQKAWARRYYLANREKKIAQAAASYAARIERDPKGERAKKAGHSRKHYANNRETIIEKKKPQARAWAVANPERRTEIRRRSDSNRLEQRRMNEAARRARKRDAFVEKIVIQVVWERDEGVCGICGKPADRESFHVDHVIPLARGGEHSYANVQVAHPFCNIKKGAR